MEGSILSRFQLDMGLSRQSSFSDSNPDSDTSPGQSWASSNETDTQHDFPPAGREPSSESDLEDFPFTPAQRRARSLSDEDQVPERELKRRKEFAEKTCTELGLAPDALAGFSQVHCLSHLVVTMSHADVEQMRHADMIIELRASILSLKQESQKDETRKYIASEEFKDVLKERLRCCLLSPNLTGYVIGTASNILVSPTVHANSNVPRNHILTTLGIRKEAYGNVQDTRESCSRPRDVRQYCDNGERLIDIATFQYQAKGTLSMFWL